LAGVIRAISDSIEKKGDGKLIGTCDLHRFQPSASTAEISCMLVRTAWGMGHMREALLRLLQYAQQTLGLTRLRADIDTPHTRSLSLFTAFDFKHVHNLFYEKEW
jgi:RimJ/RimL family protein N-acetyltransferase